MTNQTDVDSLASELLDTLRRGGLEDFLDVLDGNAYDFETVCRSLAKFMSMSAPDDWRLAREWFWKARAEVSSYIGDETPNKTEFESVLRLWLKDPAWSGDDLVSLRDFAGDRLRYGLGVRE